MYRNYFHTEQSSTFDRYVNRQIEGQADQLVESFQDMNGDDREASNYPDQRLNCEAMHPVPTPSEQRRLLNSNRIMFKL